MNDRLAALRLFVRVARTGSFSRAAREAGLSQPSVSRIIAGLEREIGAALLTRTTRAVVLTDAGADYLARVDAILADLDAADHAARGTGELRGTLRIGVASSYAVREVVPRLPDFVAPHPELKVELLVDDFRQDMLGEGVDMVLRFGNLDDSTATARRIGTNWRVLVASPDYLARAGTPQVPADLARHTLLMAPSGRSPAGWAFTKDGRRVSIRAEGRFGATANEAAIALAREGLGILSTGHVACREELVEGRLVQLLADWEMETVGIYAVFPAGRAAKPAARAFAEYLASDPER